MLDIFNSSAFDVVSLTDAINKLPALPSEIGASGLFEEQGINTTTLVLEERDGVISLIQSQPRGGPANQNRSGSRKVRSFSVLHLPLEDAVMADEVQGVRLFGSDNQLETVASKVNDKLQEMKTNHEVTKEHLRIGALKGVILDADGSEIYDLFDEFGLEQTSKAFKVSSADTDIRAVCVTIRRAIEAALGATPFSGVECLCSPGFFDALTGHAMVKAAFDRWQAGEFLRTDLRKGFTFGDITFKEYNHTVGTRKFIADNQAHFYPVGAPGLFKTYNAPANFIETVNTIGLPYYAKREIRKFGTGMDLHTQSNPLPICRRPACLIKGTLS